MEFSCLDVADDGALCDGECRSDVNVGELEPVVQAPDNNVSLLGFKRCEIAVVFFFDPLTETDFDNFGRGFQHPHCTDV